ncbi:MAG: DUF3105 domain-containing protein [Actinomycetota bacterium]|nr:DUF3105 domain-containing protein [Actinomycetota bacterium]PLS75089.1 MAG: hypothetical protein CYG61_09270 [Actinomycetota bacterium]
MAKKAKPKKRTPGKRPQPAKRPIAAGPAGSSAPAGRPAGSATPAGRPSGSPSGAAKATRADRIEAARRARRRKKLQLRIAIGAAAALVIGAIAVNSLSNRSETNAFREKLTAGSCTFDTRDDSVSAPPNNHVAPSSYEVNPPAGGNHDPSPAPAGNYEQATVPPDARVVHSLEHGYVAIWHRPGLPKEDMDLITNVFGRYENDVLVLPRASLPADTKVAATAWGERLLCRNVEQGPLTEFVKKYRNEGPEKIPHT